jgi:ABC-type transport system substrate-binding protein
MGRWTPGRGLVAEGEAFGRQTIRKVAALLVGLLLACPLIAASPLPSSGASGEGGEPPRGGTLRVVVPAGAEATPSGFDLAAPEFLDPQFATLGAFGTWELARCCLTRTLLSYNGRSTGEGGAHLQPDLAEALPDVSADGMTWTFRIRADLHYAPPLQEVEITSADFVRSFHRLLSPALKDVGFGYDFLDIEGAAEYQAGEQATISGLEAPDDHTLVIHLQAPSGDLGSRLALVALPPLPPDPSHPDAPLGVAQGADTGFGHFLISSGPYMLEGAEALDFSQPAAERAPVAGITPEGVNLVRNPSWEPVTDALRPAFADRIELRVVGSLEAAVAALDDGRADLVWNVVAPPQLPSETYDAFRTHPERGRAWVDRAPAVRALMMNLAVPPFDDPQVRRALSYVLDKQRLVQLQGGASAAEVMGHLAPDRDEDDLLSGYDPYRTPGDRGDLARAREEMARSVYDSDGDGSCDAAVCRGLRTVTREPYGAVAEAIAEDFRQVGVDLQVEVHDPMTFWAETTDPRSRIPVVTGLAYKSDYIDAGSTLRIFQGPFAIADETTDEAPLGNVTMVGATNEQLERWGYQVRDVPNVDARIELCLSATGRERYGCWAGVDQYLMEAVVPWIPYSQDRAVSLTSPRVLSYGFDEAVGGAPSLDRIALAP